MGFANAVDAAGVAGVDGGEGGGRRGVGGELSWGQGGFVGEAGWRGGRLGHCGVGEDEIFGGRWGEVDDVHLHSLWPGWDSLGEGLRRYMSVILGKFVGSSQCTCFGLARVTA